MTKNYISNNKEEFYNALTSSKERQLNNLVIKEEGVKVYNKGVLQNFLVKAITKKEDVTWPRHKMYKSMLYLACNTNYYKYYHKEKERHSYYKS